MIATIGNVRLARGLAFTAAALLLTSTAFAQIAGEGGGVPLREGNIYDHQAHQPTQSEDAAAGIAQPSTATKRQVEKEVEDLLQQTDSLDRTSESEQPALPAARGKR